MAVKKAKKPSKKAKLFSERVEERYQAVYAEAWSDRLQTNPEWAGLLREICRIDLEEDDLNHEMDLMRQRGEDTWFIKLDNGLTALFPGRVQQNKLSARRRSVQKALGMLYTTKGAQQTRKSRAKEIAERDDDDDEE